MNRFLLPTYVGVAQRLASFAVIAGLVFANDSRNTTSGQNELPLPYFSEELARHSDLNVFLDRQTGDGIIIWDQPNEDGTKLRIPVELAVHIEPGVETETEYLPLTRKFSYSFTLTNGNAARQPINFFYFVNLQDKERYQVSTPDHWHVTFPRHIVQVSDNTNQPAPIDRALILFLPDVDSSGLIGVPAGKSRNGFQILSSERPGLVDVYAQGRTKILAMPTEPSEKVREELLRIKDFRYNYRHTLAIAPKYDEQMPDSKLAESYQKDLQNLRAFEGQPATSAFFKETERLLVRKRAAPTYPVDFSDIKELAKTHLERDLATSIAVSFSSVKR